MSEDIQPGDVVVCVDDSCRYLPSGLTLGGIYRVKHVIICPSGGVGFALKAFRYPSGKEGHFASRFRKIRPADPEFIALVKRERVDA